MKIEVFSKFSFKKMRKQWFFRVRARNGEIIAQGEGYANRYDVVNTISSLRLQLPTAPLEVEGDR